MFSWVLVAYKGVLLCYVMVDTLGHGFWRFRFSFLFRVVGFRVITCPVRSLHPFLVTSLSRSLRLRRLHDLYEPTHRFMFAHSYDDMSSIVYLYDLSMTFPSGPYLMFVRLWYYAT
jgi:hypothetical protein